jgi:hypothetical protein
MTILSFPVGLLPSKFTFGLKSNAETFVSPLNGAVQTAIRPGSRWMATLEFSIINPTYGALLDAFMAQLDGMAGRFYLPAFHRPAWSVATPGTPVVYGAAQVGKSLVTAGWTASQKIGSAGDYFAVGGEFKMLVADATADGSGHATLAFAPALRNSPSDASAITISSPLATMLLMNPEYGLTKLPGTRYDTFQMQAMEFF